MYGESFTGDEILSFSLALFSLYLLPLGITIFQEIKFRTRRNKNVYK